MSNVHSVVATRQQLHWGERVNLVIILVFQVLAIIFLVSTPILTKEWILSNPEVTQDEVWLYSYLPYSLGVVFLISSIWVFNQRRSDFIGQIYSLFAAAAATSLFCIFEIHTTQRLIAIWVVSTALACGALLNLSLIFPERSKFYLNIPSSRYTGYLPAIVLMILALFFNLASGYTNGFATVWVLEGVFAGLSLLFFIGSTFVHRISSTSLIVKEQARLVLWGSAIAFTPVVIWIILRLSGVQFQRPILFFATLVAFPAFLTYAILRYRMFGRDSVLRRGIIYGGLLVFVAGSYALFVSGLSLFVIGLSNINQPILVGMVVFLIAMLLNPVRVSLQKRVDAAFFRGQEIYQENLQSFSHKLTRMTDRESILLLLKGSCESSLSPSRTYIYTMDESLGYYAPTPDENGMQSSDIRFGRSSALVDLLVARNCALFISNESKLPDNLLVDQARIAVLQAELFVPILGQAGMVGWIALGDRQSGEPYAKEDIRYLESLCDQAAVALERSQVVSALEKRIHEMDTITKVAEGINQKLNFNELLELFYKETRQLIPTVDFRITISDGSGEKVNHVFFVANNQRLPNHEGSIYRVDHSLEAEVIRHQYSIVTVDYVNECKRRKITPHTNEIRAWMSVPLKAGKEVIGAVSLGSRDPEIIYSPEQVNLLQAIADLVAGAFIKLRLLEESQKQAHQMATLIDLTRSLTSTLDIEPLLNRIMESAVEILDCEAGSLLLIDDQTGESVFKVVIGTVGPDLQGKRLPPGVGLVGKAVRIKRAIIENNVQESDDWYNADETTGFSTKDLLVVPLLVKGDVIGVLEILNKKDSSPFNHEDLELLTAFAGQVAVAIENARLYTQTDQALAARVDELSMMQRIDRELNSNLDFERIVSITLHSAMRYSKAAAGMIGSIHSDGIYVIASEGYPAESHNYDKGSRRITLLEYKKLLSEVRDRPLKLIPEAQVNEGQESNTVLIHPVDEGLRAGLGFLPGAKCQYLFPIRRESEIIGVLILENTSGTGFEQDIVEFLSRLSDHAAIAISNAQLYEELQAANRAKSEFVSAAAHELKNPLTSIKGYSDLLVAGAVGPVSEKQADFLATIRSNAERMKTLVSDLQDISRIEAGQMQLQFQGESLEAIISEVSNSLINQIEAKDQQLEINLAEDLPAIWCDNTRLVQVLTNLVSNAHKYSPKGGKIIIQADRYPVPAGKANKVELVHICVVDNGIGISAEDQARVFQQFFRSEDKIVRETAGTGLGLSITKKLVEMQGGKLWFESTLGLGTTFHFTIQADGSHN